MCYSTFRKRTILSSQSLMCGFYNLNITDKSLNKKDNYPYINVMIDEDSFLNHPISYSEDIEKMEQSWNKITHDNKNNLEELSKLFPYFYRHIDWDDFDDLFTALKSHNIFLEPVYEHYISKIFEMSQIHRKMMYAIPDVIKCSTGEAYRTIYHYMDEIMKKKNKHPPLFVTYSGHDTTLYSMIVVLSKKYEDIKPPYAAHIDIELYENSKNKEYYYKAYFQDELIPNEKADSNGFTPIKYFPKC